VRAVAVAQRLPAVVAVALQPQVVARRAVAELLLERSAAVEP